MIKIPEDSRSFIMRINSFAVIPIGGIIAGVIWSLLQMVLAVMTLELHLESIGDAQRWNGSSYFLVDVLVGIWAIGFYSLLRPNFSNMTASVVVTTITWWLIHNLMSMKWFSLLDGQFWSFVALSFATLIPIFLAALSGAWICEHFKNNKPELLPIISVSWEERG
jgi:hypothetical protein